MKRFLFFLALVVMPSSVFAGSITATGQNDDDLYKLFTNVVTHSKYNLLNSIDFGIAADPNSMNVGFYTTANIVNNGLIYDIALSNNIAMSGTQVATGNMLYYMISTNSDGTAYTITAGDTATVTSDAKLPDVTSGLTPIGFLFVNTQSGFYLPGTTLLNGGTITATYGDIHTITSGKAKVDLSDL